VWRQAAALNDNVVTLQLIHQFNNLFQLAYQLNFFRVTLIGLCALLTQLTEFIANRVADCTRLACCCNSAN